MHAVQAAGPPTTVTTACLLLGQRSPLCPAPADQARCLVHQASASASGFRRSLARPTSRSVSLSKVAAKSLLEVMHLSRWSKSVASARDEARSLQVLRAECHLAALRLLRWAAVWGGCGGWLPGACCTS